MKTEWVIILKADNVLKVMFQDRDNRKPNFSTYVTYMGDGWVLDTVNWGKNRVWYRRIPKKKLPFSPENA